MWRFRDRRHAGQILGEQLAADADRGDAVVLALPRGGVPVGYEVARALGAPLDVFVVRKLGAPGQEELAIGAVASGGTRVLNDDVVAELGLSEEEIDAIAERERGELERRERSYRGDRGSLEVQGKRVILVDDGLATGATMRAAARAVRTLGPQAITVAVPVAPVQSCRDLRDEVEEVVCVETPSPFQAISLWYEEFPQTSDDEVRGLLREAAPA